MVGLVVIGCSAGGLHALGEVLGGLPAELPVPVLVVQHLSPHHESRLAEILQRKTELEVVAAGDGTALEEGLVMIAPPDEHLVVADGATRLEHSPKENYSRPSVDALFASAARSFGAEVLAVVLTGMGKDGADGVAAIGEAGGSVLVEDPDSAQHPSMPTAALRTGHVARRLPLSEIADEITRRVGSGAEERATRGGT